MDEDNLERKQKVDLAIALQVVNEQSLLMQRAMVSKIIFLDGLLFARVGLCMV